MRILSTANLKRKIGVLGGIGPEATGEFYNKLIKRLQESGKLKSNKDFPQIIINSIPAPELIGDITNEQLKYYIDGLKELEKNNVDFIVMVCNTIHLFYDVMQKEINVPIIDLRKEVKDRIKGKCLIIGTASTIKKGLYRSDNTVEPNDEEIKTLTEAIFNFNKGLDKEKQTEKVRKICYKYNEPVLLGCTEFAVMLKDEQIEKINTIDVMVDAVMNMI